MVSPVVDEIAKERPDVKVGKTNVDEQPELARQFRVMSIPTMIIMKNGEVVNRAVGARPKEQIRAMLCGIVYSLIFPARRTGRSLY